MENDDELERFFTRLAAETGTPPLGVAEARHLLDLARVVAHEVERRYAPLTTYVLGLALDPATPPQERIARARATVAAIQRLAAGDSAMPVGTPASTTVAEEAPGDGQ